MEIDSHPLRGPISVFRRLFPTFLSRQVLCILKGLRAWCQCVKAQFQQLISLKKISKAPSVILGCRAKQTDAAFTFIELTF